jgi:hypothetical protein
MMRKFVFFQGIIEDTYVFENIDVVARDVAHGERTLRAIWGREPIEEIYTFHGIDAEDELTRMLSQEFANEIDRGVMRTMLDTINIEDETDMEVLRGMDVLNDNNELETTAMIRELTRLINGGQRA